jgi:hypothetical protein
LDILADGAIAVCADAAADTHSAIAQTDASIRAFAERDLSGGLIISQLLLSIGWI